MDSHKPTQPPEQLLDDLESIHDLLYERNEPPLLTESFEPDNIPLLSDVVSPGTAPRAPEPQTAAATTAGLAPAEQERLDDELRASAELILQEVIDDFAPQIEAELRRRLQARRLYPDQRRRGCHRQFRWWRAAGLPARCRQHHRRPGEGPGRQERR